MLLAKIISKIAASSRLIALCSPDYQLP